MASNKSQNALRLIAKTIEPESNLKLYLVATELGLILLDEKKKPVSISQFASQERAKNFLDVTSGVISESHSNGSKKKFQQKPLS